jgi:2-dehydro-3-deoxyphosphogluconate aldolase/(4S)-4-hydroxy-2-oxoglutarate aldolase
MTRETILARLLQPGVAAIIRADGSERLIDAGRALIEGGVSAIEITMTPPNALKVIADFIRAGCVAVAAGGSLVGKEILKNRDWDKLKGLASAFVAAVAKAREK